MKNILSILDIHNEIIEIIDMAIKLKQNNKINLNDFNLNRKTIVMIFERPSLRTRLSFELGIRILGGQSIYFSYDDLQIGKRECARDIALVLSRYCDLIIYRPIIKKNLIDIAKYSTIPVINGLDIDEHPCQILADLMTIKETKGDLFDLNFVFIGNGKSNLVNSHLFGCSSLGMNITIISQKEYWPNKFFIEKAKEISKKTNHYVKITDKLEAINDADVIASDTWVSYWDQEKRDLICDKLKKYSITQTIIDNAKDDVIFLHCMPINYNEEVNEKVVYGKNSVVIDEAENRLWTAMTLLIKLLI